MRGPIPFDMRDHSLAASMETGIIFHADTSTGGIEIVECFG